MTRLCKFFCISAILIFWASHVFAEKIGFGSQYGSLSIDYPEGFQLVASGNNDTTFQLQSTIAPVTAIVRIYEKDRFKTAKAALSQSLKSLSFTGETEEFMWRNSTCAISVFEGKFNGQNIAGYGAAAVIPNSGIIIILDWCTSNLADVCNPFMTSLLDSLNIDEGSYFEAGLITQYLYPKSEKLLPISLKIDGKTINSNLRENDKEAADYLIEREYSVLYLYRESPLWQEAWKRYYRMIFRDSYNRLSRVSFDIYNALYQDCKDDTDLAQKLLYWTQEFSYEREKNLSDFSSLPAILLGEGSDCDSRSMLLSVLLTSMNQDAILLVSATYSHALVAITSTHKGHSFKYDNKDYLMGETTAKGLTWGKIATNQDDPSKWIFVSFK